MSISKKKQLNICVDIDGRTKQQRPKPWAVTCSSKIAWRMPWNLRMQAYGYCSWTATRRIADQVAFLSQGELIVYNEKVAFFDAPKKEQTRDFLSGVCG